MLAQKAKEAAFARYPGRTENIMPPHHGLQQALPAASGSTDRETEAAWRSTRLSGPPT